MYRSSKSIWAENLRIDGLSIMERLRALGKFKDRIMSSNNIPFSRLPESLLAASPPAYYDEIRLYDISGGVAEHVATIDIRALAIAPVYRLALTEGTPRSAVVASWGSVGELPTERPKSFDLYAVVRTAG